MTKYVMLLSVATLAAAIFALADVVGVDNIAHAQAGVPSNVSATNGANPGEVVVSWDPVAGALEYRVGWLAVADYQANIDNDRWRERFAYSDVNASSSYTVARLTPGVAYYFITGRKQDGDIVWSAWATLTLNSGALPCPAEPTVAPSTTSPLQIANGSNIGEVVVSWVTLPFFDGYRVGWLAVPDYQANLDNDRWRERFAYSDINPSSYFTVTRYTVTRLTPGIAYYFILGQKQGDRIAWTQWASLALSAADASVCPFPASAVGGDYDHDNDGLIEVRTLAQLNAIRLDLDGDALVDTEVLTEYLAAFPGALDGMGCPTDGCKGYELAASLDFDTNGNGEADAGDAYWNDGAGWEPIGPYENDATFDGNGYTIANLYIDRSDMYYPVGLFDYNDGTIRNVFLDGVDVTSTIGSGYVEAALAELVGNAGGLVGRNYGTISNSTARGAVSGSFSVGGLVGLNYGTISESTASGAVSGNDYVGGLVGSNLRITTVGITVSDFSGGISGSTASGTVTGNNIVGGLVGGNRESISSSVTSGDVSGNDIVGGLVGWNYNGGDISGSTASGTVTGNDNVGGLVGENGNVYGNITYRSDGGDISGSAASGAVTGNDNVGGLVGWNAAGDISDSMVSGTVTGNDDVGGLVGENSSYGRINASKAEGDITGRFYVGGLVGANEGAIKDSTASGNVTGVRNHGALVGGNNADSGTITNSTGTGTVSTRQ